MKKILFPTLIVLSIALTACSSLSTTTPSGSTSNDLPIETQLAVGTLKLAGTEQDVTAKQAEELLMYWQVYEELRQSDTAAQEELDAVISQIQETMTPEQVKAITDMELTQQDVYASMQGVAIVSSSSTDNSASISSGGGMPAGGPPPDGGGMPMDMGGAALASSANQSQSAQSGLQGTSGVPSALVEAVIQALQEKIAA